jgi:hypothetical protein
LFVCFYVQIWTWRLHGWYRRGKRECFGQALTFLLSSSSGLTGYQRFARLEGGRSILEGVASIVASLCSGMGCFLSCFLVPYI